MKQMEFLQKVINDLPDIYSNIPSFTQTFSKTNKNVGIIFWYLPITPNPNPDPNNPNNTNNQNQNPTQQIQLLTGKETCYLTDKVVPEIKSILEKYQYYYYYSIAPTNPSQQQTQTADYILEEIYQQFSKRAKLLSKELKKPVYFDKPIAHPTQPNLWQTQYRVMNETSKYGIIKGSIEENETQIHAIHREIEEELFPYNEYIPLDPEKILLLPKPIQLNLDTLYTFHYQVTEKEKTTIETNIKRLEEESYGELVQYQFRTITEIFTSPQSTQPNFHLLKEYFNGKSRLYVNEFYHHFDENKKNISIP